MRKAKVLLMISVASIILSACGPGQILGSTLTPTLTQTPTPTPTPVPPTPTPGPGIAFSDEEVLELPSISNVVGDGSASFRMGEEADRLLVEVTGIVSSAPGGKICLWCFDTVSIAPDMKIPVTLFEDIGPDEMGSIKNETAGLITFSLKLEWSTDAFGNSIRVVKEPKEIDAVELDVVLSVPYDADADRYILSGTEGATLQKVRDGFLLSKGAAYFVDETSP